MSLNKQQKMSNNQATSSSPSPQSIVKLQSTKQLPSTTLSTRNLFTHYFLIHDFLFRMVKVPSTNAKFFDLQIEVDQAMRKATKIGGKVGQFGMFGALLIYCMKGNSIKLRLFYGFLYMYWIQHFYTLGSYMGLLLRMPSVYKKTGDYFLNEAPKTDQNLFLKLNQQMNNTNDYQNTQEILNNVFDQEIIQKNNYVHNDFFAKNKDKYLDQKEGIHLERTNTKLKYLDCFFTRYVYYSFTRWYTKKLTNLGLMKQEF